MAHWQQALAKMARTAGPDATQAAIAGMRGSGLDFLLTRAALTLSLRKEWRDILDPDPQ